MGKMPQWTHGHNRQRLRDVVFDAPLAGGSFEVRLAQLRIHLPPAKCPFAAILDQTRCRDRRHLDAELDRVERLGGEGVMLRQPESLYVPSRSASGPIGGFAGSTGQRRGMRRGERLHRCRARATGSRGFRDHAQVSGIERRRCAAVSGVCPAARGFAHEKLITNERKFDGHDESPTRRFEFVQGMSNKFWEVRRDGSDVEVRYGRIGTAGHTLRKSFEDAAAAERHADGLIREKIGKGYVEAVV